MQTVVQAREETPAHIAIIRDRYMAEARGDAVLALDRAILDGLADMYEATKEARVRSRLVSRGFVRGRAEAWEA